LFETTPQFGQKNSFEVLGYWLIAPQSENAVIVYFTHKALRLSGCYLFSWLVVYVKKAAVSLAVKHHCSKVKRSPSVFSTTCLLLGQAYSNDSKYWQCY